MTIRHKNTYQPTTTERVKACVYTDEPRDSQIDHPCPVGFVLFLLLRFSHDVTTNRVNEFTNSFCSPKKCLRFFFESIENIWPGETVDIPIDQVLYVPDAGHTPIFLCTSPLHFLYSCLCVVCKTFIDMR